MSLAEFTTREGVSDDEIARVHDALGFELAPEFLAYFKATNGWTIKWVNKAELNEEEALKAYQSGSAGKREIHVPTLEELFSNRLAYLIGDGDANYTSKILGGKFNDKELRENLYVITDPGEDYFKFVTLFAHKTIPNPVCLVADDHGAALGDYRPVRATTFFEFQYAYLGVDNFIYSNVFEAKGFDGDHPIIDIPSSEFTLDAWHPGDPNEARVDRASDMLSYLRTTAGYDMSNRTDARTDKPTPYYYKSFEPKSRSKLAKLVPLIQDLNAFDTYTDEKTAAQFETGEFRSSHSASLRLSPPYGKKSPAAHLYYGAEFPKESIDMVVKTLLDFGMTLRPHSD